MNMLLIIILIGILGSMIGSLIGIIKKPSEKLMYNMLAFSGGVMLAISFLQLIPQSIKMSSVPVCIAGIVLGAALIYIADKAIPHIHPELCSQEQGCRLKRTAYYLILGIFIHNFPEGITMAIGTVINFKLALVITLAIAIQKIPEGICTSTPYYYCTGKRLKSFLVSSLTIIPLIIGFLLAYFTFKSIPYGVIGAVIAATAGIMIYISGDELIPTSCSKNTEALSHTAIFSLIAGVLFVIALGAI